MGVDNVWLKRHFIINKSYLINFRQWSYNCEFYYYYLIMEKIYKTIKSNILHSYEWVMPNATPLASRFFVEMSKKRQF
jgi:hypothetical protein